MKYYDPVELKKLDSQLSVEFADEVASPIVRDGRALAIVKKYIPERNSSILDIGSGGGLIIESLKKEGYSALHALDFANYLFPSVKDTPFKSADLSWDKLPYPDNTFDAVLGWEVIEHLENPPHFIRELYRIIKPTGLVILSTPNVDHLHNRLSFLFHGDMPRWRAGNNHLFSFPAGVYKKLLMKYFVEVGREYYKGVFPVRGLRKFTYPENKFFGHTVVWTLKKK